MAEREQLENAISRLRKLNDDLEEQVTFFSEPGTWFQANGKDETAGMIAEWRSHIERNEQLIRQYEAVLARRA